MTKLSRIEARDALGRQIAAAARALASGDPLAALKVVALREDAPALALRGIAMSQLGDFERARALLRRAARGFGVHDVVARARCVLATAEIDLASRELGRSLQPLQSARAALASHGDHANAAHAQLLVARHLLLVGQLDAAARALAQIDATPLPAALQATHALVEAAIAMRRVRARDAGAALLRAQRLANRAGIPALIAEVEAAERSLQATAARLLDRDGGRPLQLHEVEQLLASSGLVVDACRYVVWHAGTAIRLCTRPVLFALLRALAEAWPEDVPRDTLVARAFRLRKADASLRARLRVEMGRLRKLLRPLAKVQATARGFALRISGPTGVVVLAQPVESRHAALLALLADGEAWSSSALALALGVSQRNVQRALDVLAGAGTVQSVGRGRTRRWLSPPLAGFTTSLLLPAPFAAD